MNKEFYELRLPQELRSTGLWGGKWTEWTVWTCDTLVAGAPYGYLHNDNELYKYWLYTGTTTTGIFETRLDALIETRAYYQHRSQYFPYGKELNEEFKCFTAECPGTHVESQPMDFK